MLTSLQPTNVATMKYVVLSRLPCVRLLIGLVLLQLSVKSVEAEIPVSGMMHVHVHCGVAAQL